MEDIESSQTSSIKNAEQLLKQGKDSSDLNAALNLYEQALEIYKKHKEKAGIASAYNNIGVTYARLQQQESALNYLENSLALWEEITDKEKEAIALLNIGWVYKTFNQIFQALEFYYKALNIHQEIGNQKELADTLQIIGAAHEKKAIKFYRQAIKVYKEIGDNQALEDIFNNTKIAELEETPVESDDGDKDPIIIIPDPDPK
ncbi:tetratricopeptide repeat protein [Nostoc sp.]|uniref:tetratricopeptide repeat protein n=1 Tax=Nostoc sp. TaxID=1180 RepID=UPI002FFCCEF2